MANTEALVLQMSADIRRMEKALNQARGQTNRQLSAVESRFDKMNAHIKRSGDTMVRDLRASFAAIGVGIAIREVTQYADAWTTARNKLAAAGVAQGQLASTLQSLADLAKETRSGFEGTVDLYAKLTRAGQQLNLTQTEVRKITETTLQAFVAGGAAASEQAAAITQLSQALGSGVLQGDELRSIRENAPLLAQAIADEFNTTIAGLKELGAEGELTAGRVARAILKADGISEAFGSTITTVAQAMENLRTEFTRYIAESRVAQTVTQALGGFIQFVTDNLDLLADAAIVAAVVIGGTLAAQAMGRFIAALKTMRVNVGLAAREFGVLRAAMVFLSGPIGAAVLGIGAALATMALSTLESASAADRAADSLEKLGKLRDTITTQTAELQAAQERLTKAIRDGGEAARLAAANEVDRLRKLVDGNRALFQLERARARQALNDRSSEFRTKYVDIPELQAYRGIGRTTLESADFNILTPALQQRRQSIEAFSASIGNAARIRNLTDEEKALSAIAQAILAYREEMRGLTAEIKEYDQVLADTTSASSGSGTPFPELDTKGGAGGSAGVRGYRTELEKLRDTHKAIGDEAERDAKFIDEAVRSVKSLLLTDQSAEGFTEAWRQANEQLGKAQTEAAERAAERSRLAVQAILDFANSGKLAEAFEQIPSFLDVLSGGDEKLLRAELTRLAKEATDAAATGFARLERERDRDIDEANKALRAAQAAGIADTTWYFERLEEIERDYLEGKRDLRNTLFDAKFGALGDLGTGLSDEPLARILKGIEKDFGLDDVTAKFREDMREAVKSALREGIESGDWGDAFKSVLAEAISQGLDSALNRVADWLSEFLFSQDGFLSDILNGASAWASSAIFGTRATGGGVGANRGYRINDRGDKGEFLFMGSNPGQVLRGSDIAGMLGPGKGASAVNINAPLIVEGSVDAVTWPKLEQAMRAQTRQIMSAMPGVVNATITDNRIQKRRL